MAHATSDQKINRIEGNPLTTIIPLRVQKKILLALNHANTCNYYYALIGHSHIAHRCCQHVLDGNSVVGPSSILEVGLDTQPSQPEMVHCSVSFYYCQ